VNSSGLDKAAYDLAKDLLVRSDAYKGIMCELLEKYIHLDKTTRLRAVADLFDQAFESAQSATGERV
jgi:hypothetical protein